VSGLRRNALGTAFMDELSLISFAAIPRLPAGTEAGGQAGSTVSLAACRRLDTASGDACVGCGVRIMRVLHSSA
jgi:hypothetical protein